MEARPRIRACSAVWTAAALIAVVAAADGRPDAYDHADDHEGMGMLPGRIHGFMGSVGLASSRDGGWTWQKVGPVVTGARAKAYQANPGQAANGTGIPSVVADREGRHLLPLYLAGRRLRFD